MENKNAVQQLVWAVPHDENFIEGLPTDVTVAYLLGHAEAKLQACDVLKEALTIEEVTYLRAHIRDLENALEDRHGDDIVDELREKYSVEN